MNGKANTLTPSTSASRIALLDIFRGFALLGIFVVNIRYMSSSVNHPEAFAWMKEGALNHFADWMLTNFFNSKFFSIFSFLFGVGFGMQINKMEEKGNFQSFFFLKRYFFLMLFGVVHVIFIWGGDVLFLYALAGFVVLFLRRIPVKYILILALLILLCPFYGHIYGYLMNSTLSFTKLKNYSYNDIVAINTGTSFIGFVKFRLYEYTAYIRNVEYFPSLLAIIFFGYSAGRYKFYKKIPETLKKLTPVAILALPAVILFRIYYNSFDQLPTDNYKLYLFLVKMNIVANMTQSFLYLFVLSELYEKKILARLIEPLAYAGRMSLTNYIMQSVVGLILFNGMFFGLYGKLGLVWLEVIVIVSYVSLIIGSKLWFDKFRYGPLEFIWRELSYKTHLKFLKNGNNNQETK
jgi:uncharacterized protein